MLRYFYRQGIKKGDTKKKVTPLCMFIQTLFFVSWFRRNSQFVSSFSSSSSKDFSSIGRSHSVHKTVLISSFSFRWLKRSFAHCFVSLKILIKISFYRFEINAVPKPSANIQRLFFLASGF